ncbi:MAG: YhjD/YihY/BrkB family envelope integrity protein [Candidatus Rokuibacteriota bacterium]
MLGQATRHGHAFVDLLRAAWIEYERDRARYLAVARIYYAIVSLVPLLLLLLAALGLLLRFSAIAADARQQMLLGIEASFGTPRAGTIQRLLNTLQQASIIATVISLAGLLLTASVLFRHLRLSFRAIGKYEPPLVSGPVRVVVRATILERLIASVMVLGGGGLLLAALGLIAASQWLDRLLGGLPLLGQTTGWLFAALSSLILAAITFAGLFKFLPPAPIRWRDVWLAALLCRRRLGGRRRVPGALWRLLRQPPKRLRRDRRGAGGHALDEHRQPGAVLRGRAVQGRRDTGRWTAGAAARPRARAGRRTARVMMMDERGRRPCCDTGRRATRIRSQPAGQHPLERPGAMATTCRYRAR